MAVSPLHGPSVRLDPRSALKRPARLGRRVWEQARAASRLARARVGYGAGLVCAAWGAGVLFGFGWALLAGGVAVSVSFLLLYPVDDR
jgi:hypothetical protein